MCPLRVETEYRTRERGAPQHRINQLERVISQLVQGARRETLVLAAEPPPQPQSTVDPQMRTDAIDKNFLGKPAHFNGRPTSWSGVEWKFQFLSVCGAVDSELHERLVLSETMEAS